MKLEEPIYLKYTLIYMYCSDFYSELSEVKDHDRRVTQEAQQAQEDVS